MELVQRMALRTLLLVVCVLVMFTEQDEEVPEQLSRTVDPTTTQNIPARGDTATLPEDKSQALNTGQNRGGCYCNRKKSGVLDPGCSCKRATKFRKGNRNKKTRPGQSRTWPVAKKLCEKRNVRSKKCLKKVREGSKANQLISTPI
ncbi:hypothetical protein MATL_G00127080 [Megalops atlanticus]|uniref:Uncharacterized protein n=1 Tax=Megalops atlanticus TaxID=7932 RepID=A0A9D3PUS3_MEGAT|nr:hypothetical protein MATL_G00127080 [Megalops atlanticus]